MDVFTSAGFLLRHATFAFVKWAAIITWLFISSGDLSRTVSQNGTSNWSWLPMHVSTTDHISLHKTSVAT